MDNTDYRRARLRRVLSFGSCLLGLFVIHFAVFRDHWLARRWFPFDFPAGYYATVAYWVTSLQSGEWPQWIPYQSMGYPLLMNPQIGFFYPPFWIFVILRIPYTLHAAVIVQILHVLFGAIGFLLLANRLFGSLLAAECGAVAFLLFGGFYTNAEHTDIIRGFAWVPWLLWASLRLDRQLARRNLLLPALVACFITGAYMGQVIAGLLLLGLFLVLQAVQLYDRTRDITQFRILLSQFVLLGVGVLLASAFLLTGAALSSELTRAHGLGALPLAWLANKDLFDFIFPSTLIHPGADYSMNGMQLPVVLLLFLPLIERKSLKRLWPFLVVGMGAALMSFQAFTRLGMALRKMLPVLALSRFPPADYRELVYLAVLLLATGGVASSLSDNSAQLWKKTAAAISVVALFGLASLTCLQHNIAPASVKEFLGFAKGDLLVLMGTTLILFLCWRYQKPQVAALVLLPLMGAVMYPLIVSEKQFWADPDVLKNVYDGQGFPLQLQGRLRTAAIFGRHETARGPRVIAENHRVLSWWGYLDGAYLTNDSSGAIALSRRTAELNPALLQFMLQGTQLLTIPCDAGVCDQLGPVIDLANRPLAGRSLEYSRNFVKYEIQVPVRSLVVENELAIRGWHVEIDGQETPLKTVDGCLRGWVIQAGKHQVYLHYQTPLLIPGLLLSAAGLLGWTALLWFFHRRSEVRNMAGDCVILVSSDRTGG